MKTSKKTIHRFLAALLSLCMLFSLVPNALAAEPALSLDQTEGNFPVEDLLPENSEDSIESGGLDTDENTEAIVAEETAAPDPSAVQELPGDETSEHESALESPDVRSGMVPGDGAHDTWAQDPATVAKPTGGENDAAVRKDSDGLFLQSGTANKNNGDATTPPALFLDQEMNAAFTKAYTEDNRAVREFAADITFPSDANGTNICFGVYLNYKGPNNGLFLGHNTQGGWFWQQYGPTFGGGSYGAFTGPKLETDKTYRLRFLQYGSSTSEPTRYELYLDNVMITNGSFKILSAANGDSQAIGFKLGTYGSDRTAVKIKNLQYTGQAATENGYSISGTITSSAAGNALIENAAVEIAGKIYLTNSQGKYTSDNLLPGTYPITVKADEFITLEAQSATLETADITDKNFTLTPLAIEKHTLSTDYMDVEVDQNFPRVIKYTTKTDPKIFYGQTTMLDTLQLNGNAVKPTVTSVKNSSSTKVTYTMTVDGEEAAKANLSKVVITADLLVGSDVLEADRPSTDTALAPQTLAFQITKVEYPNSDMKTKPLESIYIPNHSLISVRSNQTDANLKGAALASNTITSGDTDFLLNANANISTVQNKRYFAAFVSNDTLSASLASNSDSGNGGAGGDNYPVRISAEDRGAYKTVGLGSDLWYFDRRATSSETSAALKKPVLEQDIDVVEHTQLPFAKVVLAGDMNESSTVDWQDGAIAFRDTVMHVPFRGEDIPDVVSTRIAMNFGSQAQNPFLTSLDNGKRVALETDGLGQGVMLKGYASEGHDSGHPDYPDVGERMGGVADFKTMTEEGKELGIRYGIHVNASEFYPEATAFEEDLVRRTDDPGNPFRYGWNWIDQGIGINGIFDLASGKRAARFSALGDLVGSYENGGLDFVYVDVWGNNTAGSEDAWQTRKLSNEITSQGWRITHEWGYANPYESTFQHWTSDFGYGGYDQKGKLNSQVLRFILNSYKDAFVPDYAWYGGAANAPLLGGPSMKGFEGWQGEGEYADSIYNIFNQMIPTKFLQHYNIEEWKNAENTVSLPYATASGEAQNATSNWLPEAQITLANAENTETVVVTRGTDSTADTSFNYGTAEDKIAYRSRVITLDDKEILKGAPRPADFKTSVDATLTYLIPWFWDAQGDPVAETDEKLYHWNAKGGDTTWTLPAEWSSLSTVNLYQLGDKGRTSKGTVSVSGGQITLTGIEANTGYVVTRGESGGPAVAWTAEGAHVTNGSFNGGLNNWTTTGTAVIHENAERLPMLKFTGEGTATQTLTGLSAGKTYAVYVGVDNRSSAKASLTIKDGTKVLDSNYTTSSIAKNYVKAYSYSVSHPIEEQTSYFQNMYVFFTAPASGTVSLALGRETGDGNTYFDDVRVVETAAENFTRNAAGEITSFTQDFENVVQGEYPFVVGPIEGAEDNRQHLAKLHDPYTQADWDVKKMDDVLEGNWSLKVNGLVQRQSLVFQTIPQNFHFQPGKTYTISFDYQMGSPNIYQVVVGDGAFAYAKARKVNLEKSLGTDATCTFTVVGSESGQSWFGIYSTGTAPDLQGTTGAASNFGGYKEIVLDNLNIQLSQIDMGPLSTQVQIADKWTETTYGPNDPTNTGAWATFAAARTTAQEVLNSAETTQVQVDNALKNLNAAMESMHQLLASVEVLVTDAQGAPLKDVILTLEDANYNAISDTTVKTDSRGIYLYQNLPLTTYQVKAAHNGHQVQTWKVADLVDQKTSKHTIVLPATPTPTFALDGSATTDWAALDTGNTSAVTIASTDGQLHFTFNDNTREKTDIAYKNNTYKLIDGVISFDVTPKTNNTNRFGFNLRSTTNGSRIYVGLFDSPSTWGWEYWGDTGTRYSPGFTGPSLSKDVTRHVMIAFTGKQLTLTVDGVAVLNNVTLPDPILTAGYFGLNARGQSGNTFVLDNVNFYTATTYPVTVTAPANGTVAPSKNAAMPGETVVLTSLPKVGYVLDEIKVNDGAVTVAPSGDKYTFTMPSGAATVIATFKKINHGITIPPAKNGTVSTDLQTAGVGDVVTITTTPNSKYVLKSLKVTGDTSSNEIPLTKDSGQHTFLMPTEPVTITAEFKLRSQPSPEPSTTPTVTPGPSPTPTPGDDDIVTEETKNPDGSTTITETNKTTGTVKETTNAVDGSTYSFTTTKDSITTGAIVLSEKALTTEDGSTAVITAPLFAFPVGSDRETSPSFTVSAAKPVVLILPLKEMNPNIVAMLRKEDSTLEEVRKSTGSLEIVRKSNIGDKGLILPLHGSEEVVLVNNSKPFSDVGPNHWAGNAIAYASSRELFQGITSTEFAPKAPLNRAMLVTVLHRLENTPKATVTPDFDDVPDNVYYTKAVAWAVENKIVFGTGTGFSPQMQTTRETLAVMLYRYASVLGMDTSLEGGDKDFADSSNISRWATDAMKWAVKNGILLGDPDNRLHPKNNCTRAEAATMIQRFVKLI